MHQTHTACYRCGNSNHSKDDCYFKEAQCRNCNKTGHIAKVCRSKQHPVKSLTHKPYANRVDNIHCLNNIKSSVHETPSPPPMSITMLVNERALRIEIDTGSAISIISTNILRTIMPNYRIQKTDRTFLCFNNIPLDVAGFMPVKVYYRGRTQTLNLYVTTRPRSTLMGREWISPFCQIIPFADLIPQTHEIVNKISEKPAGTETRLTNLIDDKFKDVFSDHAGTLIGPPAELKLKPDAVPKFAKAREVPLALRHEYAAELDHKIKLGQLERVNHSRWASTTHCVTKKNRKLRITGNYKL